MNLEDRKKIVAVGHIALDYIFNVERFPEPNTSIQIPSVKRYYGGSACNVAVAVAKLGLQSAIVSCVGYDFINSGYSSYLKNLNIDVSNIYHSDEEETPKAWIFTDPENNQITFFLWGAAKHYRELKPPTFDGDLVHLATGDPGFNVRCVDTARRDGRLISFDPGQDLPLYSKENMEYILENVDFVFMNNHEYRRTLKLLKTDEEDLRRRIPVLVVTFGERGSVIYSGDREIKIPSIPTKVEDPTGAGDSYRAGFLTAYLKGYSLKDCGIIASAVASFVVEKRGCQTNLPSWRDVMERLKERGYTLGEVRG
ncbi:MAG TPA: carbohydrate kinase family protein [Methanothermococcus okinawensis]|uniref:Carbohydrate kinase family protein n=1 Tax=Methanothermococcus okinawensis TaxID=155863 RepID=A0A832ZL74_9EURY|nr:carbohydrate kinase family protein [Methanococcaceae archaeon]HIP83971.1 carbohydrate kinase family protein [Methanothermococcus okinawensis]HIP91572.1 carbohydrate kinase family protein [Methanothermococcus okinawensis]